MKVTHRWMISLRSSAEMRGEEAKLPSKATFSTLPPPEELEALAVPGQNGVWLHHNQTVPPAIPDPREQRPEGTLDRTKLRPRPSMYETRKLMAQGHILGDEICTVLENGSNNEENRWEFERHLRIIVSVPMCRKSQQFCRSME
jgi:hypothetical protein